MQNYNRRSFVNHFFQLLLVFLLLISGASKASPIQEDQVPSSLQPWIDWVLFDVKDYQCPFLYNSHKNRRCAWPTSLDMNLQNDGGTFQQEWRVYQESWLRLPGNSKQWPQDVSINGEPVVVDETQGIPMLRLDEGQYVVTGAFSWKRLPESLQVPADVGLLRLQVNSKAIQFPDLNKQGQLWLRERDVGAKEEGVGDTLSVRVFRNILDHIPLQVTTQIQIDVSGAQREVVIGSPLLEKQIPWSIHSPLPTRLEPDGNLRVQVRPGHWVINVTSRNPDNGFALQLPEQADPWPGEEVWVFSADTENRLVEVSGVTSIDPRQTKLPAAWQKLPAYRMKAGDTMSLKLIRRGNPDPEPDQLSLNRNLWLDFDGKGYTVQDKISGTMTRKWRLDSAPGLELGRVVIDGKPQFINSLKASGLQGVEVRRGKLNLEADSRINSDIKHIPVLGWGQDFQSVNSTLHLPPGWSLFSASGMDNVPYTWVNKWTLLDLFMVLILSIAVVRLWDWRWGLLAILTLALTWHEQPFAPQYIWAHLLLAISLLRVLKPGRFCRAVTWYRNLSLIALLLVTLPFMVEQVRNGIYPQLEHSRVTYRAIDQAPGSPVAVQEEPMIKEKVAIPSSIVDKVGAVRGVPAKQQEALSSRAFDYYDESRNQLLTDPKANIQTGPGLPVWSWNEVQFRWNGPVKEDQEISLVMFSPWVNMLLNFLRVGLIAAFFLLVAGVIHRTNKNASGSGASASAVASAGFILLACLFGLPVNDAHSQEKGTSIDHPSDARLQQLKQRLLAPADCLPQCAQASRMKLSIDQSTLQLRIEVHAQQDVAVPLPSNTAQWLPDQVTIDGDVAGSLYRDKSGSLWAKLEKGRHQVILSGALPSRTEFQLPLTLTPKHLDVTAEGWNIEGIHDDGQVEGQLKFTRLKQLDTATPASSLEPTTLPPFVRIERVLSLGLDWRVRTRVIRATPPGSAVLLEIPMLEGESLLSENFHMQDGKVLVNMADDAKEVSWQSVLKIDDAITLTAPVNTSWTEVWRIDVSPVWHITYDGIPVVHHTSRAGNWLPEWRPWPGESVNIAVARPEGIGGRTLTIERSNVKVSPGKRATDVALQMDLRSSQGGQHKITLPEDAELQKVRIDGKSQPIRQEGRSIALPVTPGKQRVEITWRNNGEGIQLIQKSPVIDLGTENVNTSINLTLGQDRWVLFVGGPLLGPAVLFWGVLIVVVLVSIGLGRVTLTPLKTWQWILLGVGLSPVNAVMALIIIGWLMAMGLRARMERYSINDANFNSLQVILGMLTIAALVLLFYAIQQGLLGLPDMQVSGNMSSAYNLNWYQDRSASTLPQAWVVSVPLMVYRVLMLLWALWLAFSLLKWLTWAWQCFSSNGVWRERKKKKAKETKPADSKSTDQVL